MTATDSEIRASVADPATATGNETGEMPEAVPSLRARAMSIVADLRTRLPDTRSSGHRWTDLREKLGDLAAQAWSAPVWDIQPPSLAELCRRTLDGPWNSRGWFGEPGRRCKTLLARKGMAATLVWSSAFYALAVMGQPWWLSGERSARLWDLQPPTVRDLAGWVTRGPWMTSDERLLRVVAATGLAISLTWTVTCYTLAVLGQRFWRAFWSVVLTVLIWNLI